MNPYFMNPYTLWNIYVCMRTIHGVYITYHFFSWLLGGISNSVMYVVSFIYNPYQTKQLKDIEKNRKLVYR